MASFLLRASYEAILQRFAENTGLVYERKCPILAGFYHGYPVAVSLVAASNSMILSASAAAPEGAQPPEVLFSDIRGKLKGIRSAVLRGNRLEIVYNMKNSGKKQEADMQYIMDCITFFLNQNGWRPACECCDSSVVGFVETNGVARCMCESCASQAENTLERGRQETAKRKGNFLTGLIGALLGALIGVALWVIVAQLGYILAAIGLAIGVLAIKGFELLGGKINIASIITCCVIAGAAVLLANGISLGLDIYSVYKADGVTVFECIAAVPDFLSIPEVAGDFWKNNVTGLVFTYLALIPTAIGIYQDKAKAYAFRRIAPTYGNGPEI